ncbi:LOW QUALITY PROTEIN: hypothetical protein IFM47457_11087 [Aspergillus lentulus]|nr:LOW QUALITY PROTEIN: hypothetical protein IFM47457_11087 [Aspergillus lentulus]
MALTEEQLRAVSLAERVGGTASLLGCLLIFITYCVSAAFRRPINRLIFYASFGNIFSAVASLMSMDGITAGPNSALCQTQAFFIQYWMPADSLWSFCMALNIYLTFYRRYTEEDIKKLEKWYFLLCYGLPLVLATVLISIKTDERGRIYGPALIWCSISGPWQFLRLVCFYGPVWYVCAYSNLITSHSHRLKRAVSIATFAIYVKVGSDIFRKHRDFKSAKDTLSASETIRKTHSITVQVTTGAEGLLAAEGAAPYAVCIESQQSRSQNRIDAQNGSNRAMWGYIRYSFLFFIAMVVTWIPSSINRIYGLVHPNEPNFGLNLAGALVLSLQGFWNTIIYVSTTMPSIEFLYKVNIPSTLISRNSGGDTEEQGWYPAQWNAL